MSKNNYILIRHEAETIDIPSKVALWGGVIFLSLSILILISVIIYIITFKCRSRSFPSRTLSRKPQIYPLQFSNSVLNERYSRKKGKNFVESDSYTSNKSNINDTITLNLSPTTLNTRYERKYQHSTFGIDERRKPSNDRRNRESSFNSNCRLPPSSNINRINLYTGNGNRHMATGRGNDIILAGNLNFKT